MKLIETDFDKTYDELSKLNEERGLFIINKEKSHNIKLYCMPEVIKQDLGTYKVRQDSALPIVSWKHLIDLRTIEALDDRLALKNQSGIYVIKNDITNQLYFGKASDFYNRYDAHERARQSDSKFLHMAINYAKSHPEEKITFSFAIYKHVDKANLNEAEIKAIADWDTFNSKYDYNLTPGGEGQATFEYADHPEVYQMIAQKLHDGWTDDAIISWMNSNPPIKSTDPDIPSLPPLTPAKTHGAGGTTVNKINNNPRDYAQFIPNIEELIYVDDSGKETFRSKEAKIANQQIGNQGRAIKVRLYQNDELKGEYASVAAACRAADDLMGKARGTFGGSSLARQERNYSSPTYGLRLEIIKK